MKSFREVVFVKHPLETVWSTVRDRLPELAPMLDDIESISPIEREHLAPGRLRLVNEWRSEQRIPGFMQHALGGSSVSWLDHNEWDDAEHRCTWAIEPSILPEHIYCAGTTRFEPAMGGRGTRITFAGEFELTPGALRAVAGSLEQPASAFVESVVTIFIPRNLRKVMDAVSKRISADQAS